MNVLSQLIEAELSTAQAPCLTSSFQADGVVLLHMVRQVCPDIPVLFLDTVHHFPETIAYRDEMVDRWRLNLVTLRAAAPRPGLWRSDAEACCRLHKVEPLFAALDAYDLWLTALRRDQSSSRANLAERELFHLPSGHTIRKVSPLVNWKRDEVLAYAQRHDIPLLPLYDTGYLSIGCEPCTTVPTDASNARSGRWQGRKLECGIHLPAKAGSALGR